MSKSKAFVCFAFSALFLINGSASAQSGGVLEDAIRKGCQGNVFPAAACVDAGLQAIEAGKSPAQVIHAACSTAERVATGVAELPASHWNSNLGKRFVPGAIRCFGFAAVVSGDAALSKIADYCSKRSLRGHPGWIATAEDDATAQYHGALAQYACIEGAFRFQ